MGGCVLCISVYGWVYKRIRLICNMDRSPTSPIFPFLVIQCRCGKMIVATGKGQGREEEAAAEMQKLEVRVCVVLEYRYFIRV
jgi:hypothetical protein